MRTGMPTLGTGQILNKPALAAVATSGIKGDSDLHISEEQQRKLAGAVLLSETVYSVVNQEVTFVELLTAGPFPEFHPSLVWVEAAGNVAVGWTYANGELAPPKTPPASRHAHRAAASAANFGMLLCK